jgi:hypothetical protein
VTTDTPPVPAGWYPDPSGEPQWRVWNGGAWTALTRPFGTTPDRRPFTPADLELERTLRWYARLGLPAWFVGFVALVNALWYGPAAPHPLPLWERAGLLGVGVVGLTLGTVLLAFTLRALEGRWSASALCPGFNLFAVSSLLSQRLSMPVGRRLLTLAVSLGLFAWRVRVMPAFAVLPGLAALDGATALAIVRRELTGTSTTPHP